MSFSILSISSISKGILQVVLVYWNFFTGIHFHKDTGTELIPVIVKEKANISKSFTNLTNRK